MKIRVLLVDDEKEIVNVLAERLTLRDFEVSKAFSGDEALQVLEAIGIDVVILDVMLPGMDGLATLREIKRKIPLVEVIMLTGHGTFETAVEGMRLGAFDFLIKPVDTINLIEKIAKAYRRKSEQEDRIRHAEIDRIMGPVGNLAAGIAHEINNPVAIMVEEAGWIDDLIKDGDFNQNENLEELKRALLKIKTQGERCKEITQKLLSFARQGDARVFEVQINNLIAELITTYRRRLRSGNIGIETEFQPNLPPIQASPSEVQQVLLNILNNAVDAIGTGTTAGLIQIRTRVQENWAVVDITDNGKGIPDSQLERIFDPFFTTKPVGKGTGLGLSICYGIVKKLGGDISVESQMGLGTTFHVRLPIQQGE